MTTPPEKTASSGNTAGPGTEQQLLSRLERALSDQLSLARKGDLAAAVGASDTVRELMQRLEALPRPLPAAHAEQAGRILKLYRQVRLTLAQRREELAGKLEQLGRGKRTLKAYRGGSVRP